MNDWCRVVSRAVLDVAEYETGTRPAPPEEWLASFGVLRWPRRGPREYVEVIYRDDIMVSDVSLEDQLRQDPDVSFRNLIIGSAHIRGYRSVIFWVR